MGLPPEHLSQTTYSAAAAAAAAAAAGKEWVGGPTRVAVMPKVMPLH